MERISIVETEHPKKLKTCEEVNKDFFSDLPDSVLLHILSFLPLKDAIKTVLLPRFGKMWLNMPVLDLDNCAYHTYVDDDTCDIDNIETFMDIIHQVWNHHSDITPDKIRLNFSFSRTFLDNELALDPDDEDYEEWVKEKNAADQIEKLIIYALYRKVKFLDLNFKDCTVMPSVEKYHELPDFFRSNHLKGLRLGSCYIRSCEKLKLPALKVLSLHRVLLSDQVMAKVLLECPTLEDLSVNNCYGLRNLTCGYPNLKKLEINLNDERKHLYIACPHVVSLDISGLIERAKLLDVSSSLVDATITYCDHFFICTERKYADVLDILLKVQQCKNFQASGEIIMVLSIWALKKSYCLPHFKWKNITLKLELEKWNLPGLCSLLQNSPHVEALDLHKWRTRACNLFQRKKEKWIWKYDFDGKNYWDSQVATFPCMETITIHVYAYELNLIQMVKFLLKNAPRLEKMVIVSYMKKLEHDESEEEDDIVLQSGFSSEEQFELSQKLLMLPRASSPAMIHFREIYR